MRYSSAIAPLQRLGVLVEVDAVLTEVAPDRGVEALGPFVLVGLVAMIEGDPAARVGRGPDAELVEVLADPGLEGPHDVDHAADVGHADAQDVPHHLLELPDPARLVEGDLVEAVTVD